MTFSKGCQSKRVFTEVTKNWNLFLNILEFKILVTSHVFRFFSWMMGIGGGVNWPGKNSVEPKRNKLAWNIKFIVQS